MFIIDVKIMMLSLTHPTAIEVPPDFDFRVLCATKINMNEVEVNCAAGVFSPLKIEG